MEQSLSRLLVVLLLFIGCGHSLTSNAEERNNPMHSLVVDMHYQSLMANGWTAQEAVFIDQGLALSRNTTVSVAAAAGTAEVTLNNVEGFAAGMLIVYQSTDGEFYPGRIYKLVGGNVVRLDRAIVAPIAAGGLFGNFYMNDAHPGRHGGGAIADDALRQLSGGRFKTLEYSVKGPSYWSSVGGATLSGASALSYANPGDATPGDLGVMIDGINVGGGAKTAGVFLDGGDHEVAVVVNIGLRTGGYSGSVQVFVDERKADGTTSTVGASSPMSGYEGTYVSRVKFSSLPGSSISIRVTTANGGGYRFYIGMLQIFKLGDPVPELNTGKHVIFGDSWVTENRPITNRLKERLSGAEVVMAGVPGNSASQLLERFDADVASQNPDYVWVMVGTNDTYAGVTTEVFNQQIGQLKSKILAIGATPIFFTPSVGAITYTPPKLHPSRSYAQNVDYYDRAVVDATGYLDSHGSFQGTIPAGSTVTVWVFPGMTKSAALLRFLLSNSAAYNVRFEYVSTSDGAGGSDPTIFPGASLVKDILMPRTNTQNRLIAMRITNPQPYPVLAGVTASVALKNTVD